MQTSTGAELINLLELPEIATSIIRYLDTEERARKRLVNRTFNQVYLIEEENEFVQLWNKYESGYCGGYHVKALSDEELMALEKQFDMNIQYHLKIWLTKCSNGRFEWQQSLLAIANVGDWEYVRYCPLLQPFQFDLIDYLGEDQMDNYLCVHFSTNGFYIMDKRNGKFYHSKKDNRMCWKPIGNIKDWLENIPYDILYPLSETRGETIDSSLYNNLEVLKKLQQEENSSELLKFISNNPNYYIFLNDEFKRREDILSSLLPNCYENPNGFIMHLPAHIPFDLRNDKDFLMKYFKIADFCYYIPTNLRRNKEIFKELICQHSTSFSISSVSKEMLRDTEIFKSYSRVIIDEIEIEELIEWELETVEQVKTFFSLHPSSHIVIPYISDVILNDRNSMIEIINEAYQLDIKPEETLCDLSVVENLVTTISPMILSIVEESVRNNKDFMTKLGGISIMFIGSELKKDLDIISRVSTPILKKLNLDMTKEEYIGLFKNIHNIGREYLFLYKMNMLDALKYQIPRDYFEDLNFAVEIFRITLCSERYFGKQICKDVSFWNQLLSYDLSICGVPKEVLNRDVAMSHIFSVTDLPEELLLDSEFMMEWIKVKDYPDQYTCLPRKTRANKKLLDSLLVKHPFLIKFAPPEYFEKS